MAQQSVLLKTSSDQSSISHPPVYVPPKTGLLSMLPVDWVPYGELIRIDKPTGIYLFYLPHLFGTLYIASLSTPKTSLSSLLSTNAILFAGTVFMRGAACAWNDNIDREYDRQVFRCRLRPIARGAISPRKGHYFTASQAILAYSFLTMLPIECTYFAVPSIGLLALYPFAKRFTDYPQAMLGVQVSIGVLMGATAVNKALLKSESIRASLCALSCSVIAWTIIYDTIYAHQDIEDDVKAGVKSMAIKFRNYTKMMLSVVAAVQVAFLVLSGVLCGMNWAYFGGTCGGAAINLACMIWLVDLKKPTNCFWWFRNGCWLVGGSVTAGLFGAYLDPFTNSR